MTTINNEWITLDSLRKGVTVQRKFAGLDTLISDIDNSVLYCKVKYYERELYPNGDVIKTEEKYYILQDLTETVNDIEKYRQEPLAVLTGFINSLGYDGIINPTRETITNINILPLNVENGYPLKRDTRTKIDL